MTSLHVIRGLAPQSKILATLILCIKSCAMCIPDACRCIFVLLHAPLRVVAFNIANMQNIRCIASILKILWYGSMEWNMEEIFSMEWNGRFLVWNGRKLLVWNMEKSSSIPFHTMPCSQAGIAAPTPTVMQGF